MPGSSWPQPNAGTAAASADPHRRAPALQQHDIAPAPGPIAGDSLLDTDPPEAGSPMDREAGAVLDRDPGLEGPDPGGLGSINQSGEERPADPPSLHIGGHVDAQPGHPGIDLPARARGGGGPR